MNANQCDWWTNTAALAGFISALAQSGEVNVYDAIRIVEKPWKYTREFLAWRAAGSPDHFDMPREPAPHELG